MTGRIEALARRIASRQGDPDELVMVHIPEAVAIPFGTVYRIGRTQPFWLFFLGVAQAADEEARNGQD